MLFRSEGLRDQQFIMVIPGTDIAWSKLVSIITFALGVIGLITCLIIYLVKKRKSSETPNAV